MGELPTKLYSGNTDYEKGFYKLDRIFFTNKELSTSLKGILPQILDYQRLHPNTIITKQRCMTITGESERIIDKVYSEAEKFGYMKIFKLSPNMAVKENELGYIHSGRIQYVYVWYESPKLNPYFNGELDKEITEVVKKEKIKMTKEKKVEKIDPNLDMESKIKLVMKKAKAKFDDSIYGLNHPNLTKGLEIPMSKDMEKYVKDKMNYKEITSSYYENDKFIDECYKFIIRATSNNQETFDKFMELDSTKEKIDYNATIIWDLIYRGHNIFKPYYSMMYVIRESKSGKLNFGDRDIAKTLFFRFTQVIVNFIRCKKYIIDDNGNRRIPEILELQYLYYTLICHPELIGLDNTEVDMEVFNEYYKMETEKRDNLAKEKFDEFY